MLNVAVKAARAAGAIINRGALDIESVRISAKQTNDFVTEVDHASEQAVIEVLLQAYPDHGILGEESGVRAGKGAGKDFQWIIDPLDGTTNFTTGLPFYSTTLALMSRSGGRLKPMLGWVLEPSRDELFSARLGGGARLNGADLPPPVVPESLRHAVAGVDFKRLPRPLVEHLVQQSPYASQRNLGSIAIEWCYLAAGRIHVYLHGRQKPWDFAAGRLILEEVGGVAQRLDGGALDQFGLSGVGVIAAGNAALQRQWLQALKPGLAGCFC